ncbi:UDP-glucuronosyltransferase 2B20-like [Gigantopelta aegis]|uniref:UDP-glucuronosyltransferase 2B20-like n=1 Tax=Gigantopelta aegis TaxID=1735272 RepID=UPI001B889E75|nr:UDP-glucuronosyltransferase 2B20-like [Gigantopelta aegis]XP_041354212.1 UDP-glucuronosyltransferase 2B20-like [Gigantopelta aegis]
MNTPILLLLTACVVSNVKAANILLFPGLMAPSICNEMRGFGEELINRGHKVTFYLSSKFDRSFMSNSKIRFLEFRFSKRDKEVIDGVTKELSDGVFSNQSGSIWKLMSTFPTMLNTICDAVFADKDGLDMLKAEQFDLVVVETIFFTKCLCFLPRYLNVPYVGVASTVDGRDGGLPFQALASPHIMSTFSDSMSFLERLKNVAMHLVMYVFRPYVLPTTDPATYDPSLAGLDAEDLVRNAVLYLENSDHVVDYPKALMPNFVQVGGLTASPAGKLPKDLETFISEATDGVVVVSFGSILREAPKEMMNKLMTAFSQLKQRVLFKTDRDFVEGNIKSVKWIPQNDVLGHPKVKLFISHCGKNSFFEGVYHGVPIICTPLNGDAYSTASKVVNKQIGLSLDLKTASASDIVKTVNTVLTNTIYGDNMRRTSLLLRDRPETPTARAASAIEHVLKYGGEHLRAPSRNLPLMSYVYADLWLIIFSVIIGILYVLVKLARCICCRKRSAIAKTKSD